MKMNKNKKTQASRQDEISSSVGLCTGANFGGARCPAGSPQYNLAKQFRKSKKPKLQKNTTVSPQNNNIEEFTQHKQNMFKSHVGNNTRNVIAEEELINQQQALQQGYFEVGGPMGMEDYGYNPALVDFDGFAQAQQNSRTNNANAFTNFGKDLSTLDLRKEKNIKSFINPEYKDAYKAYNKAYTQGYKEVTGRKPRFDTGAEVEGNPKNNDSTRTNMYSQGQLDYLNYSDLPVDTNSYKLANTNLQRSGLGVNGYNPSTNQFNPMGEYVQPAYGNIPEKYTEGYKHEGYKQANPLTDRYPNNEHAFKYMDLPQYKPFVPQDDLQMPTATITPEMYTLKKGKPSESVPVQNVETSASSTAEEAVEKAKSSAQSSVKKGVKPSKVASSTTAEEAVEKAQNKIVRGNGNTDADYETTTPNKPSQSTETTDREGVRNPQTGVIYPKTGGVFSRRGRAPLYYNPEHTYLDKASVSRGPFGRTKMNFIHNADGFQNNAAPNNNIQNEGVQPSDIEAQTFITKPSENSNYIDTDIDAETRDYNEYDDSNLARYGGVPKYSFAGQSNFTDPSTIANSRVVEGINWGRAGKHVLPGAMDMAASIGNMFTQPDYGKQMENMTSAENVFSSRENTNQGNVAFNDFGLSSNPQNYTPVQFTGGAKHGGEQYEEGGEYELSDEEIKLIRAQGGTVEYI